METGKLSNYKLIKIRQHFSRNEIADIKGAVSGEALKLRTVIKPGAHIAVAVGSRGINNLTTVIKEVLDFIKAQKAFPFIVPAMGSHGGATAEGQEAILAGYGITEKNLGVPIRSSMEVVELAPGVYPGTVYMDKIAYESDGVILVNRIKPHTDYHDAYESGLVKMTVIGLGNERQASAIHRYGVYGLSNLIPLAAKEIFSTGKILGGIALVENAYDETMLVRALGTGEILEKEPALLDMARKNMPSLPVGELDVLIIDKMGKDISGVGLDTNIIGRISIAGQDEPEHPDIGSIAVLDLTDRTHGNAIGLGLADVITRKLFDRIDFPATYGNAITSSFLERVKIPIIAETDEEALEIALRGCGNLEPGKERIIRIQDTLHLAELYVSQSLAEELTGTPGIEIIREDVALFGRDHQCSPF